MNEEGVEVGAGCQGGGYLVSAACIDGEPFLKATPHTEGDDRFLLIEPTNEERDIQGHIVPRSVLARSAAYYHKFGNVDISHRTHPKVVEDKKIENPREWEIGRPVEVHVDPTIVVKAQIYAGHKMADWFWSTQVAQRPPMPWWPSIGGQSVVGPDGVVTHALWDNIGLDNRPVNKALPTVTVVQPVEMLKALVGAGGTDKAELTGGAALRRESLRGAQGSRDLDYWQMSSALISLIAKGDFYLGESPNEDVVVGAIAQYFRSRGVSETEAGALARRFILDVGERMKRHGHEQAQAA